MANQTSRPAWRQLIPDPFILLLLSTVGLATILPAKGAEAVWVGYLSNFAIVMLFFFHGAKLSREAVLAGLGHWRLHLMIFGTTFLLFPLLGVAEVHILHGTILPSPLLVGILYLAVLPSTVQSSIAFTSMARGNVPAAIAAASVSQVLGVFLTPIMIGMLASARGGSFSFSNLGSVLLIVLVPFIAGQIARTWIGGWVGRHKSLIGITDRSAILLAVYSAFSSAVVGGLWSRLPLSVLALLAAACIVLLAVVLAFTQLLGKQMGLPREDRITLIFCGSKKSLVQGIPMAKALFSGPDLGLILLPIMIFHQIQLMACAWIARRFAEESDV